MLSKTYDAEGQVITLPPLYSTPGDEQNEYSDESAHLLLTIFRRVKSFVVLNFHSVSLTSACVLAILTGLLMRSWRRDPYPPDVLLAIKLFGILYQRFLQGMQLPLIVSGIVVAVGTVSQKTFYRIQVRLYICQVVFTSLAIIISVMLMVCLAPGGDSELPVAVEHAVSHKTLIFIVLDVIRNLCPPNIFESLMYYYNVAFFKPLTNASGLTGFEDTVRHYDNPQDSFRDGENVVMFSTFKEMPINWNSGYVLHSGTNFLGVTFATVVVSLFISDMRRRARVVVNLCADIQLIMFEMIKLVNLFSPLGVFSLLLGAVLELDLDKMTNLVAYCFITIVALVIHCFVTLPFIFMLMTNTNPVHFIFNQTHASLAAFCTNSELTPYAVNLDCVVTKNLVDARVANIVLTLSAFYNKNGSVIVHCTGTLFVAQVMRVSLTIGQLAMIGLVAVFSTIGSEDMTYPEINLLSVDLNPVTFSIIASASKFLNAFASACDTFTSAIAAAVVANLSQQNLNEEDKKKMS